MHPNVYELVKRLGVNLVPAYLQPRIKIAGRKVLFYLNRGSNYVCNVCFAKLARFMKASNGNIICPKCGSTERARTVLAIMNGREGKVLHFSPNEALSKRLKGNIKIQHTSTDYMNEFEADESYDITSIPVQDDYYDIIICMHVLEHIEDDKKAIHELYRILKPEGMAIIQTPFKQGDTYENPNLKSQKERLEHFGQEDHVRVYSLPGLKERLELSGFYVKEARTSNEERELNQLSLGPIFIAQK